MGRVIVLGSTITDLVARAPHLPLPGESIIGDDFATFLGGKGFNQAIAAARQGTTVAFIGRVGTDTYGDSFSAALSQEGIDNTHLTRDPAIGTGTASVMIGTDMGQNAIIVLPQANLTLTAAMVEDAIRSLLAQPKEPSYTHIFMAQCEMRIATIAAGLRFAREAGMTTIFNAAPAAREPLEENQLSFVDILIVNESEATALSGIVVDNASSAMQAATHLLTQGPKQVIITLGTQGCVWSAVEEVTGQPTHEWIPPIPVAQVDATAAGDAFCGVLAAKLAEGLPMKEALRWASAAGAITVTRLGALPSLPRREEVEAFLLKEGK